MSYLEASSPACTAPSLQLARWSHRRPCVSPGQPRCSAGFICPQPQARDIWQAVSENILLDKINRASYATETAASLGGVKGRGAVQVGAWLLNVCLLLGPCPQATSQPAGQDQPEPLEGLPGQSPVYLLARPAARSVPGWGLHNLHLSWVSAPPRILLIVPHVVGKAHQQPNDTYCTITGVCMN